MNKYNIQSRVRHFCFLFFKNVALGKCVRKQKTYHALPKIESSIQLL